MTARKGLFNIWFSVTKTARNEKAIHIFIQWVALLGRWGVQLHPITLDRGSRSFWSERTKEGQQHERSLLLYVRNNWRNAAKALQTALQQDAGVHVSDQTVRNRLQKAKHHLVRPVHTCPALKRKWLCKRTKLEGLPLASNRVSEWDELFAKDLIKRERDDRSQLHIIWKKNKCLLPESVFSYQVLV